MAEKEINMQNPYYKSINKLKLLSNVTLSYFTRLLFSAIRLSKLTLKYHEYKLFPLHIPAQN